MIMLFAGWKCCGRSVKIFFVRVRDDFEKNDMKVVDPSFNKSEEIILVTGREPFDRVTGSISRIMVDPFLHLLFFICLSVFAAKGLLPVKLDILTSILNLTQENPQVDLSRKGI